MSQHTPESEQPEKRARVLSLLRQAGDAGLLSDELCKRADTHAAVRRAWELISFYGYVIIGEKLQRNCWRWTYVCAEAWAVDPSVSVREAKRIKAEAEAKPVVPQPSQPSLLAMMGAA